MNSIRLVGLIIAALLVTFPGISAAADGPYQATTESLRQHQPPKWFNDAKFGIFIHWGPYAVPAFHEWFVEFMSPSWPSFREYFRNSLSKTGEYQALLGRFMEKQKAVAELLTIDSPEAIAK